MKRTPLLAAIALAACLAWPSRAMGEYALINDCVATQPQSSNLVSDSCEGRRIASVYAPSSPLAQAAMVGAPMLASGLITKWSMPHYAITPSGQAKHDGLATALEFTPGVVMLGLKAAGVESRSSWPRLLASDAMGGLLAVGTASLLKNNVHEMRPDGSDRHSFPSGHATVSFALATMMAREYGWRSPWYTAGAYTVAATSSMLRVAGNRHWAADVATGAGIGIVGANLGYALGDILFGNKGLNDKAVDDDPDDPSKSSISVNTALAIPLRNASRLCLKTGVSTSLRGNLCLTHHWLCYASLGVQSLTLVANNEKRDYVSPLTTIKAFIGPGYHTTVLRPWLSFSVAGGIGISQYLKLKNYSWLINTRSTSLAGSLRCSLKWDIDAHTAIQAFAEYQTDKFSTDVPTTDIGTALATYATQGDAFSLGFNKQSTSMHTLLLGMAWVMRF